jgi:hypothetical protein
MSQIDRGYNKRITRYISYRESGCVIGTSGVAASTGTGDMVEAEVGSLDIVALVATAGDKHTWYLPLPRDMNITKDFGVRVKYSTASTTAADTHTWITLYGITAEDAAPVIGVTAMDTTHVVASDTDSGVANAIQKSTRAALNANTFTEAQLTGNAELSINVELDATDASETIHIHGIYIDYVPKRGLGNPGAHSFDAEHDQE